MVLAEPLTIGQPFDSGCYDLMSESEDPQRPYCGKRGVSWPESHAALAQSTKVCPPIPAYPPSWREILQVPFLPDTAGRAMVLTFYYLLLGLGVHILTRLLAFCGATPLATCWHFGGGIWLAFWLSGRYLNLVAEYEQGPSSKEGRRRARQNFFDTPAVLLFTIGPVHLVYLAFTNLGAPGDQQAQGFSVLRLLLSLLWMLFYGPMAFGVAGAYGWWNPFRVLSTIWRCLGAYLLVSAYMWILILVGAALVAVGLHCLAFLLSVDLSTHSSLAASWRYDYLFLLGLPLTMLIMQHVTVTGWAMMGLLLRRNRLC
ncbi:MAG TPA: hypothetical protein PKY77_25025 [Phycisphaerae bacterium]|nr:hypothetical protein [Phycisphaerae bacterium]HRY71419.1 hypothetical protein [Phycisphaerae bacterium]HSA30054.1 hypothetical protein [Phycisphaerae bacterium]